MFNVNDKVIVWWRGEETPGKIIEKLLHRDCYRVRLNTGEMAFRMGSDLEPADGGR